METQNLLHERSADIPEGLYLELMNKLKKDFDNNKKTVNFIIINKSIAKLVACTKIELRENIIKASIHWEDREEVLIKIIKMCYHELRKFCKLRDVQTLKINPRWQSQETLIQNSGIDRALLRDRDFSPGVINL
jgi:hypothetical protein